MVETRIKTLVEFGGIALTSLLSPGEPFGVDRAC